MLGCGNSTLSEDVRPPSGHYANVLTAELQMYDDGYRNIVNVDVGKSPYTSEDLC